MRFSTIALKELWHRKPGALVILVGIALCVALIVSFQRVSLGVINEIRKATLEMGRNIVILPNGVSQEQYWTSDYGDRTLPQTDVKMLADYCSRRKILARHFLGSLEREITIKGEQLILSGIMVEIDLKAPKAVTAGAQQALPPGDAELGYRAAESLGLKKGDPLTIDAGTPRQTRAFNIVKVRRQTGTVHDHKVYVDISVVQEMFGTGKVVNVIEAVSCLCARQYLPALAKKIERQLFTKEGKARGQAYHFGAIVEARRKARQGTIKNLNLLTVLAAGFGALVIAGYSVANARERRREMGILLAIAARPVDVGWLFLLKMLIVGGLAGLLGCWVGDVLVKTYSSSVITKLHPSMRPYLFAKVGLEMYAIVLGVSLVLTFIPSLVGVVIASRTDPAETLREL